MFDAKSLTEDQVTQLHRWTAEGDDLATLQRRLAEELEVRVTYMEMRFLAEDLKLEIRSPEPEPEPEVVEEPAVPEDLPAGEELPDTPTPPLDEGPIDPNQLPEPEVTVVIDKVQRPGTVVSGKATFPGGKQAEWWMDQMGQLGMDPDDKDFRPSQAEQMAFQRELQEAAAREGL